MNLKLLNIFILSLVLVCGYNNSFAQIGYTATGDSPCSENKPEKSFNAGETVFVKSFGGNFEKQVYGGYKTKRDPWGNLITHHIHQPGRPNYVWTLPQGESINDWVLTQAEYDKLDKSKGECAMCCTDHYAAIFKADLLKLINDYRAKNGIKPLKFDRVLDEAAQKYAEYGASHSQAAMSNGHRADGSTPHDRILAVARKYDYTIKQNGGRDHAFAGPTGENAVVFGEFCAEDAFERWKKSPPHDGQMKNPNHVYIGIGVACGLRQSGSTFLFAINKFAAERWPEDKNNIPPSTTEETTGSDNPDNQPCEAFTSKKIFQTTMDPGDQLYEGQHLLSANGQYQLRVRMDGELVIEEIQDPENCQFRQVWQAPAAGRLNNPPPVSYFSFNRDCNFCFGSKANKGWCATDGLDINRVIIYQCKEAKLTDDGRLVLLNKIGQEIWSSAVGLVTPSVPEKPVCEPCNSIQKYQSSINPGDQLYEGQHLISANGRYQFRVTMDGDLVIEEIVDKAGQQYRTVWKAPAAGPINAPPTVSVFNFNMDCNLCFNSKANKGWCMTNGLDERRILLYRCDKAIMTNDGRLVLVDRVGSELWSTPK